MFSSFYVNRFTFIIPPDIINHLFTYYSIRYREAGVTMYQYELVHVVYLEINAQCFQVSMLIGFPFLFMFLVISKYRDILYHYELVYFVLR